MQAAVGAATIWKVFAPKTSFDEEMDIGVARSGGAYPTTQNPE
jgi:hypothetical protein